MIRRRNYTFALTKDNERVIKLVKKYPKYAYIKHDKDDAEEHYHYYIEFENARSLNSVARELNIPENMIEQVYSKSGILNYLTHENSNGKYHYDISEITSNFDLKTEINEDGRKCSHEDYVLITTTLKQFYEGKISYDDLVRQMEPLFCLYNSARVYDLILKTISGKLRHDRACLSCQVSSVNTPVIDTKYIHKKGGSMT